MNKRELAGKFLPAALFFMLLLSYQPLFANTDSTKTTEKKDGTQYPLDDPRNPNCPCHQFQKIADEEFAKLQKENHTVQISTTNDSAAHTSIAINSQNNVNQVVLKSPTLISAISGRAKHKYRNSFFLKIKRVFQRKHKHWKKPNVKIAVCFLWK